MAANILFSCDRCTFFLLFYQLEEATASIKAVLVKIEGTEIELKNAQDQNEKDFLRQTLVQLRTKEEQLRTKEEQLRDELKPLRAKELQLMEEAKQLPETGSLPYPGATKVGFNEEVWNTMCLEVQERVLKLLQAESQLTAVKALSNMRGDIDQKDAAKFGIKVLLARGRKILLGVFDVPALENVVDLNAPKGISFHFVLVDFTHFVTL
jgi:hypothetical protein